jgi:hypothetical protein
MKRSTAALILSAATFLLLMGSPAFAAYPPGGPTAVASAMAAASASSPEISRPSIERRTVPVAASQVSATRTSAMP